MVFKLILRNIFRHKLRAILTILGIAIAVSAFGFIRTVINAWYIGVETSSSNRLITRSSISIAFDLPLAYREKIASVPHVTEVTHGTWFGGIYKDPSIFFAQFAIDPATYFKVYPEIIVPEEQMNDFLRDRSGAVVGRKLAERFGWKVGDVVRLTGTIYEGDWDLTIRGIYAGKEKKTDETQFFLNWKYLDERVTELMPARGGNVGFYIIGIDAPDQAAAISKSIDEKFANSPAETMTETESAFQLGFVTLSSAIITGLQVISFVIITIIMLVLANTMLMSARERFSEYAVLKTLGFENGFIYTLIIGESLGLSVIGCAVGIVITYPITQAFGEAVSSFFPVFDISTLTLLLAVFATLVVGALSGIFPATKAVRMSIVDGMRQIS
jgi:putative ABC transport system permease protein